MKNGWEGTPIDEVCDITSSKRIYRADYEAEGVPFYRGKEIIEKQRGVLAVSTELFISEEKFQAIEEKFGAPHPGDLLLTSVGTLGVPYIVQPGERFYFKDGNLTWFRNLRNIDNRFLYYWLLSPMGKAQLGRSTIGSSQPALTIVLLKQMEIDLPNFPIQRKIAAILSAYDDLIENNLQRIKILEEMAQTLYREWFLKFHFPGHEKTRMVDSPLGKIPEGWEVIKLLELADVTYGFAFKSKQFNTEGNGKPVVRIRDVLAGVSETYSPEQAGSKYLVENGDILVGMDGEFHMGFWVGGYAYLVQRVARFRSKVDIGRYHLFLALHEPIQHFNATITGTTVAHLGHEHIKTIEIVWPKNEARVKVNRFLEPLLGQVLNLRLKNQTLRQTRDILLPKLISGELDVSDLDI
jgi:type I restriction enzyme S subunit